MLFSKRFRFAAAFLFLSSCAVLPLAFSSPQSGQVSQPKPAEAWSDAEVLSASDFVREISAAKRPDSPTIIYVGFRTLFEGGHVPGALFHGTASTEKGLAALRESLSSVPHSANLVIYCGCCPFDRCPNIRPAYKLLHGMGFSHVRVLVLPTSFAADWVEKGYPIEKGLR